MMLSLKKEVFIFLVIILFIASFLRFYDLDHNPTTLFGDEVDVGYQAYSILKTGKDYSGNPWPINFQSLGDWRTPLYLYSAVPTVGIFGLNEWGVRVPAAFFGVLGIFLTFLLVRKLLKNDTIALLAAFFLSISPWHLQYSRAGFEVTLLLFLLLTAVYFFLKGLENNKFLILSAFCFSLTPFVYSTAKLFTPLIVIALVLIFKKQMKNLSKQSILLTILIILLFGFIMGKDIIFGHAKDRFQGLVALNDPKIITQINLRRSIDANIQPGEIGVKEPPSAKFFHNKGWAWGFNFINNYFSTFSPEFLFLKGDPNFRQSIFEMGELYLAEFIFLIIGLYFFLKNEKGPNRNLLLVWFLLAPLPASLTSDGAKHATRLFIILPVIQIFVAYGFYQITSLAKKSFNFKILLTISIIFLVGNFIFYVHRYYVDYPYESAQWWNYGNKQSFQHLKNIDNKYNSIIISTRSSSPMIHFLFYYAFDPEKFQKTKIEQVKFHGINAYKLDKYYFGTFPDEIIANKTQGKFLTDKILYMGGNSDFKDNLRDPNISYENLRLLKTVDYPDGGIFTYIVAGASDMTDVLRNEGLLHD